MKIKMKMPDLATNEGVAIRISSWLIDVGQPVKRGQPLLEVETDKALQEVECIATGTLEAIHAQPGEDVQVGAVIATIGVE
jgi:pyruvate/2-oxoglutarate dehydrogenase complex dihydrolipoamide acyltransferase (E2) component